MTQAFNAYILHTSLVRPQDEKKEEGEEGEEKEKEEKTEDGEEDGEKKKDEESKEGENQEPVPPPPKDVRNSSPFSRSGRAACINARSAATS